MTLAKLKKLAESLGCSVEDDRVNTTLQVHALNDKAWEGGVLSSLVEVYGSCGSYLPEWRNAAISEMYSRLETYGAPKDDFVEA